MTSLQSIELTFLFYTFCQLRCSVPGSRVFKRIPPRPLLGEAYSLRAPRALPYLQRNTSRFTRGTVAPSRSQRLGNLRTTPRYLGPSEKTVDKVAESEQPHCAEKSVSESINKAIFLTTTLISKYEPACRTWTGALISQLSPTTRSLSERSKVGIQCRKYPRFNFSP